MLCFVPVLHGRVYCYVSRRLFSSVCNYLEEGYGAVRGALVCVFVGFWDRDYVSQLPCVRYYVFVKSSFKHTREECESKRAHMFYCLLDMRSGECDVVSLYVLCCSVNGSVCFVCCVFDSICELFGETIRNMFGCVCYFVVECYGLVKFGWRCSIG